MFIEQPRDVFSKIKKTDFLEILKMLKGIEPDLNIDLLYQSWCEGCVLPMYGCWLQWDQEARWIESLKEGKKPLYSVYNEPAYINEAFFCWRQYSRKYLLLIDKWLNDGTCPFKREDIKSVIDLGCGLGLTTVGLKGIFPNATCYGTNDMNTLQFKFNKLLAKSVDGVVIADGNFDVRGHVDIVFASEFFEHIEEPIAFLKNIIDRYAPNYIIFANTFCNMATGHFWEYIVNGEKIKNENLPWIFSKELKANGYKKVKTNFYNGRPHVYAKIQQPTEEKPDENKEN